MILRTLLGGLNSIRWPETWTTCGFAPRGTLVPEALSGGSALHAHGRGRLPRRLHTSTCSAVRRSVRPTVHVKMHIVHHCVHYIPGIYALLVLFDQHTFYRGSWVHLQGPKLLPNLESRLTNISDWPILSVGGFIHVIYAILFTHS